ncbi:MAG: glycosyl transferase [Abditibacteriota bacterium]|nr:glycosyl transferase [Abditibacteriota bacterium]
MDKDSFKKSFREEIRFRYKYYIKRKMYIPDRIMLKKLYMEKTGKKLNLINPKTFSEKLQWMKLYYRRPLFTIMADKYRNRFYVEKITGKDYSVPLLGKWDRPEDIDFNNLPNEFVLKTNHDDKPILILDKERENYQKIRHDLYVKLNTSFYAVAREWAYKNIKRCIYAEELLGDGKTPLLDYKFFCFDGEVKFLYIFSDSTDGKHGKMNFYDRDFEEAPFNHWHYPKNENPIPKPENFDEMVALAEQLSKDIPFVRVDMFNVKGKIYVGEFTFYPTGGYVNFEPKEYDEIIGSWLKLPFMWKKKKEIDLEWYLDTLSR